MRILVTNDDGIDSVGLHKLARAMHPLGDVVVAAPDTEYSGASAAFGALHLIHPEMHRAHIDGIDEAWAVSGPPALCVMFARLGAFGDPFDIVVSGINPGANVGRAVYHSGTVGAAITARNGGISGVAVSQAVSVGSVMGQAWDDMVKDLNWDTAAAVAAVAVESLLARLPSEPACLNINVPDLDLADIKGWTRAEVGDRPTRALSSVRVEPKEGHEGSFYLKFDWGSKESYPDHTDVGAVEAGYVATTWLSKYHPIEFEGSELPEEAIVDLIERSR